MSGRKTWPGESPEVVEVLSERKLKRFTIRRERVQPNVSGMAEMEIESAFTHDGLYIGDVALAKVLCDRHGIKPEKIHAADPACRIGFSDSKQRWYGWSHRAMYGFGPGDTCKWDDIHFIPSNRDEFLRVLREDYELDGFTDIELESGDEGVKVSRKRVVEGREVKMNHVEPWPAQWGRGEWIAETMDDARQMAVDFAEAVS